MESNLLEKRQGRFYHEFEEFSESRRQEVIRLQLGKLLQIAVSVPFYKEMLSDVKIDLQDQYPLAKLPTLSSSDLRLHLPPENKNLMSKPNLGHTVFQSGGTTGAPKTSLFSFHEMELINECNARGFFAVGLNSNDRVANLWAVGGLYMTFIHMNRMLMEYGCMSFPFSNQTPVDFIREVAKSFKINCFTGITSVLLNCLREIHQKEPGLLKIEKLFFGGEHIYESDRQEMKEKFGTEIIQAPGYGTVDSWYLGYQCLGLPNGVFHAFDDMAVIEIYDEDQGKHCAPGEIGMLYATPLYRVLTPILRYRVGDRARWLKEPCRCGRTTPLFELLGRGDDVLRIGYDSVDYDFVQALLAKIPGTSASLQIQKTRVEGKDQLTLKIESKIPQDQRQQVAQRIIDQFDIERPSFREFVKKGTVLPLRIEWFEENQLPRNLRTGKLIRVVDAI